MSHSSLPSTSPALTSVWLQDQNLGMLGESQGCGRVQKTCSQYRLALRACWAGLFLLHHLSLPSSLTASGLLSLLSPLQSFLDIQVKPQPPNSCCHHPSSPESTRLLSAFLSKLLGLRGPCRACVPSRWVFRASPQWGAAVPALPFPTLGLFSMLRPDRGMPLQEMAGPCGEFSLF